MEFQSILNPWWVLPEAEVPGQLSHSGVLAEARSVPADSRCLRLSPSAWFLPFVPTVPLPSTLRFPLHPGSRTVNLCLCILSRARHSSWSTSPPKEETFFLILPCNRTITLIFLKRMVALSRGFLSLQSIDLFVGLCGKLCHEPSIGVGCDWVSRFTL